MRRVQNVIAATEEKGKETVNMDAPMASLMAKYFCEGYEKQAKKEEKEAEEIVNTINSDALKALCTQYDNKSGHYPDQECEGAVVFAFFEELKADVEKRKEKEEKRNEEKSECIL